MTGSKTVDDEVRRAKKLFASLSQQDREIILTMMIARSVLYAPGARRLWVHAPLTVYADVVVIGK